MTHWNVEIIVFTAARVGKMIWCVNAQEYIKMLNASDKYSTDGNITKDSFFNSTMHLHTWLR